MLGKGHGELAIYLPNQNIPGYGMEGTKLSKYEKKNAKFKNIFTQRYKM